MTKIVATRSRLMRASQWKTLILGVTAALLAATGFLGEAGETAQGPAPALKALSFPAPKGYVCYRATAPIQIDGRLDEESWKAAPWTDAFVDIQGDVRPRPRFQTRGKMLWDDTYFYVGALLEEPHVWGTLTKHDSVIFQDNDFEIFIDPDGDNQEYYEIEINALNTEWDLFLKKAYRDGGPAINEWEIPGLKTAVHVSGTLNNLKDTDQSWSVEFAIPWKVLAEFAHRPRHPGTGTSGGSISPELNGSTGSSAASTSRCPTTPRTIGSGRPRGPSTCTGPNAGGTSSSRPLPPAKRPTNPTRPANFEIDSCRSITLKEAISRKTSGGQQILTT